MEKSVRNNYLPEWRKFKGLKVRQLESMLPVNESGEPYITFTGISKIEKRDSVINRELANVLSEAMGITSYELLFVNPYSQNSNTSKSDADFAQLMGYIDAGLTTMYIDQSDIHHDPDSLKIAYKDGNRCVALRVRGTSMMPDYKPDSIIIFGEKRPLLELVNQDILAKLTNGAVVLKRLKRGENGSWRLVSTNYEQFEPIENAEIEYARPVEAIILRKM